MDNFEERVRERARRLWVEEGCPGGRSDIRLAMDAAGELYVMTQGGGLFKFIPN